jgi:hypothetical protein
VLEDVLVYVTGEHQQVTFSRSEVEDRKWELHICTMYKKHIGLKRSESRAREFSQNMHATIRRPHQ